MRNVSYELRVSEWSSDVCSSFRPHIVAGKCAFDMQLSDLANILRAGGLNQRHLHPGNHVSLVYYVETGGVAEAQVDPDIPETSGALELMDPRGHFEMATLREDPLGRNLIIRPENGRLVAFPRWLYHQVTPYQGEGERIPKMGRASGRGRV